MILKIIRMLKVIISAIILHMPPNFMLGSKNVINLMLEGSHAPIQFPVGFNGAKYHIHTQSLWGYFLWLSREKERAIHLLPQNPGLCLPLKQITAVSYVKFKLPVMQVSIKASPSSFYFFQCSQPGRDPGNEKKTKQTSETNILCGFQW